MAGRLGGGSAGRLAPAEPSGGWEAGGPAGDRTRERGTSHPALTRSNSSQSEWSCGACRRWWRARAAGRAPEGSTPIDAPEGSADKKGGRGAARAGCRKGKAGRGRDDLHGQGVAFQARAAALVVSDGARGGRLLALPRSRRSRSRRRVSFRALAAAGRAQRRRAVVVAEAQRPVAGPAAVGFGAAARLGGRSRRHRSRGLRRGR